jgi:hypothetical protein
LLFQQLDGREARALGADHHEMFAFELHSSPE